MAEGLVALEAPPRMMAASREAPMRRVRMLVQGRMMVSSLSLPMSAPFSPSTPMTVKTTSLMRISWPTGSRPAKSSLAMVMPMRQTRSELSTCSLVKLRPLTTVQPSILG